MFSKSEPVKAPEKLTAAKFKKDISKVFGGEMRRMGFKGSGFRFTRDSDGFLFVIGIQGSNWGPSCCVEFGVQPKAIRTNGFNEIDFKRLKYYECELRTRLSHDRAMITGGNTRQNRPKTFAPL